MRSAATLRLALVCGLFAPCSRERCAIKLAAGGQMAAVATAAAKFKKTHQQHSGDDPKTWKSVHRFGLTMH